MSNFISILQMIETNALEKPDEIVFASLQNGTAPTDTLTYAQLRDAVASVAQHLRTLAAPGERVILLYEHAFDFVVPFIACLYAGLIAVPTPLPNTFTAKRVLSRMQGILQDAKPVLVLTTSDNLSSLESTYGDSLGGSNLHWVATDQISSAAEKWSPVDAEAGQVAYLQYTSGSTSSPKGVMVTFGNITHQVDYLSRLWVKDGQITGMVCWMPYYHDMGLFSGIFFPIYQRIPCYLMSPVTFIRHPEYWLEAVSSFRASHTVGPVFAYELCSQKLTPEQVARLDLSCLKLACLGAEPIRAGIIEEFIKVFEPFGFSPKAVQPGYGLAEATLGVTGNPVGAGAIMVSFDKADLADRRATPSDSPAATLLISSGRNFSDVPVLIVNEKTLRKCGPGEIGEIWVGGDSVAAGYWNKEEENRRVFQAFTTDTNEGPFLRTGDLGFIHEGFIYIAGRIKDMMIFQGQNFYPQDIEWVVQESHPALQSGACAAYSIDVDDHERLVITQEVMEKRPDQAMLEQIASAIRRAVATHHGISVHAVVLIRRGTIPKTSSGKIQRHAARQDFLTGKTESVLHISYSAAQAETAAPKTDLEAALLEIFEQVLKVSPIGVEQDFFELGGDSLAFLQVVDLVEERLGLNVPLDQPLPAITVRALAEVLRGKGAQNVDHSHQDGFSSSSAYKVALQQLLVNLLKLFPYSFTDGFLRWYGRQRWVELLFFPGDRKSIAQLLLAAGQPAPSSKMIAEWIYSGLLYHWRIAALNTDKEFAHRVRVSGLEHLAKLHESEHGTIILSSNTGLKHLALHAIQGLVSENIMQVGGGKRTLGLIGLTDIKSRFMLDIEEEMVKSKSHLSFQIAKGKQVLEQGGMLFIAGDGSRGLRKLEIPFLKRLRPFGTGFAELAVTTDATVIPVFTFLRADGTAEVHFHPALTVPPGTREEQVRSLVEQYARLLEEYWKSDLPNVRRKQIRQYLTLPPVDGKG